MKYIKRPIVIEATQWFHNGDHPDDNSYHIEGGECYMREGQVVRYYRDPEDESNGEGRCKFCGEKLKNHGWIDNEILGGIIVCPLDWVITGEDQQYYTCKPDIFDKIYRKYTIR